MEVPLESSSFSYRVKYFLPTMHCSSIVPLILTQCKFHHFLHLLTTVTTGLDFVEGKKSN